MAACVAVGLLAAAWQPTTPPLANVALTSQGTRVVADTQYGDHAAGANAADGKVGDGSTCWFSKDWTQLPCALTFEFQQPEHIRRAILHQARWNGSMYHTKDFAIEVSDDGSVWRRVGAGSLPDDSMARTEIAMDVVTRWARVVVLTSHIAFQTCGFSEVEFLADREAAIGAMRIDLDGRPAKVSDDMGGHAFAWRDGGPQALVSAGRRWVIADLRRGETVELMAPVTLTRDGATIGADAELIEGSAVTLDMACGGVRSTVTGTSRSAIQGRLAAIGAGDHEVLVRATAVSDALVRLSGVHVVMRGKRLAAALTLGATQYGSGPPPTTPPLRAWILREMVRLDWEAQDGIGADREPVSEADALERAIRRGRALASRLAPDTTARRDALEAWRRALDGAVTGAGRDSVRLAYLRVRAAKRALLLAQAEPLLGPTVFVKQTPSSFSHQLTQYYGRYARPGGGLFVLDRPGRDMLAREIARGGLPVGSAMQPEVSWDGKTILFAYCEAPQTPSDTIQGERGRYYSLYRVGADGSGLRRLTRGPYDDFSPRYLPDGRIVFISTRRGGWHRCGTPGCENYVLTVAEGDGSRPRPISFHETQEWDPAVLHDGRIVYTRWDYVDRHPVFYEHLWTTGPDGTRAAALFGNNTFNPIGVWEARPVPGSGLLIATAAAHHAMTAGSIILVDPSKGVDGLKPITRLTPDAPFPESETTVPGAWHAVMPGTEPYDTPENRRTPGHCYRSPYPLSERLFLAAYSFRGLVGEPRGNPANMFGIYLCDADGNKELLYRDPNIASVWPVPLRPRRRPPVLPPAPGPRVADTGVFVLQDVYASLPRLRKSSVKALRIVQVLPKSTPGKDLPPIGIPSGAPGKQVLGTVPVEPDGSAHFVAPARKELAFQALDERGLAVQVMRSGTYLQPGEHATCVGCHEPRASSPPGARPLALRRQASRIRPGPDGSRPFSYPVLVQPILDRKCVACHSGPKAGGGIVLTGEPDGPYTRSYNALAPRVAFSDMSNGEAISKPGRFGAHGSPLMKMLERGHQGVRLTRTEVERLATWMDVSALFYGTFDRAEQERQRRGERIACPKLE
jgi:hypothetical protein